MLKIKCYICKKELEQPGAILFGPQEMIENDGEPFPAGMVQKYHICTNCYYDIYAYMTVDLEK